MKRSRQASARQTGNIPVVPVTTPQPWRRRKRSTQSMGEAFANAFRGISAGFEGERNARIHLTLSILAVALGIALKLDATSWIILVFTIGLVLTAEFLNTAIERVVDLASDGQISALARDAKDIAAGAVLLASITALVVGLFLFVPPLCRVSGL